MQDFIASEFTVRKIFVVIDKEKIAADIAAVLERQYLHDCNGCEIERAGAEFILMGQVNKVSALLMSMIAQIKDVNSGERLYFQTFDFRGDTDQSWLRAERFFVNRFAERPPF